MVSISNNVYKRFIHIKIFVSNHIFNIADLVKYFIRNKYCEH